MTAREWVPGDVAMVVDPVGGKRVMVHIGHDPAARCWHGARSNGDLRCLDASQAIGARPLVVIDPEDREQVERLVDHLVEAYGEPTAYKRDETLDRYQAALRSLIEPLRPPEPMGLGAVVEVDSQFEPDEKRRLVRTHNTNQPWFGDTIKQAWDEIPGLVRVLSEGVTA